MIVLLLGLLAPAAPVGHANPPDIAARSALYKQASEQAGGRFQQVETQVQALDAALEQYGLALDLLGDRASAAERQRYADLRTAYQRERAVLAAFATTMMEDFDGVFSAAMERATPEGTRMCATEIPSGAALPGMPAPMKKNPDCTGPDLNDQVAAAMDDDPALQKAVRSIVALEWPGLTVEPSAQPAVGGSDWIHTARWFQVATPKALRAIDRDDAEAREGFEAAIEQGADKEQLKGMLDAARAVTERTAGRRASLAGPVLQAVDGISAKREKKGDAAIGWCANPALLGGCEGTDRTDSLGRELMQHKKVIKALGAD